MHSHDRTLLARLGFSDPDHKDGRHDKACMYISQSGIAETLFRSVCDQIKARGEGPFHYKYQLSPRPCTLEYHIQKGEGQYATTIGFADIVLNIDELEMSADGKNYLNQQVHMGVEVKISRISIGDILRQLKLYRSYLTFQRWAVVTDFPITLQEFTALRNEGFFHFELGDRFDSWLSEQSDTEAGGSARAVSIML